MITIPISQLKPALTGLAKVISKTSTLECLRCLRVDASPEKVILTGTDLDMYASVSLPEAQCDAAASFLLPFERLQSMTRKRSSKTVLHIEPDQISCDLGTGRVSERIEAPALKEFPAGLEFHAEAVALPETFSRRFAEAMGCSSTDTSRYVLNGIQLDVDGPKDAGHYLIGTDGRHLFSANSFELPLRESITIPNHKLLLWRGLLDQPWALASEKKDDCAIVRVVAGAWTLTMKTIDGKYPDWRQVVPHFRQHRTTVEFPDAHEFSKIVNGLPGGDVADKPVELVTEDDTVSICDAFGASNLRLAGATAKGPDIKIRLNREYLIKAFNYGLTNLGLIDDRSPLHFSCEGRQMVVMPLCAPKGSQAPQGSQNPHTQPAPQEPQPERTMTETNGQHSNGTATSRLNGATRSTTPVTPAADQPALEAAIDKIDCFKATFRETLIGMTELTTLLKQAVRDQKAGEKEIKSVRQTIRSLQSVRI